MTKTIKPGTREARAFTVERAAIDAEARTVELAFSSETPYERWWGVEILDHSPQSIRLGRLTAGGPLLMDHDSRDHVGVIESVQIGADRVGRAVVRFGRSARAEEVWQDVQDGIRRNVSVGYVIHKAQLVETGDDGDADVYRVTDWEPLEVSLVSVPADATVGVGRSADSPVIEAAAEPTITPAPIASSQEKAMQDINVQEIETNARAAGAQAEQARVASILAIGQQYKATDLAADYCREGKSVEEFRAALLERMASQPLPSNIQLSEKEAKQYSYVRAIAAALARAEGNAISGFEVEISQELERNMPANYKRNGGIFVPLQVQRTAIAEALYNTSGKGASTVFTQAGEFIDMLRNASVAVGLGARVINGLTGPVSFPAQTGGVSVAWVAENSGTDATASNATLGSVSLTPKTLQGTTAFSRQLMAQSSLDVEAFIREDLAAAHALAWDVAVMHGSGNSNQPTGIYAASNVNAVAMGGVPSFGKLIDMVTEVLKDNALAGSLAFATTPGMAGKLAQTVIAASTDTRMIWDGKLDDGALVGYKAVASNQVSATLGGGSEHGIIFGNWSDALIGMWGALELVVDPYSLKKQGMIEVTSFQLCDIALRHPQSFCKATGATIA